MTVESVSELGRNPRVSVARIITLVVAIFCTLALVALNKAVLGYDLLYKYEPDWSVDGWIRIGVTASIALLAYLALDVPVRFRRPLFASGMERKIGAIALSCMGAIVLLTIIGMYVVAEDMGDLVREGKPVSFLTEVAFVGALVLLAYAAIKARSIGDTMLPAIGWDKLIWLMFAVVFVVLMEEMSWGQHWIGWQAGEAFAANEQNETNLHNFATHRFEALYYTLAFVVFIVLPWIVPDVRHKALEALSLYLPPRGFALAGIPLAGFMYNDWNFIPYQIMFFFSLIVAIRLAFEADDIWKPIGLLTLFMAAGSQVAFLQTGSGLEAGHELTEVKEFMISVMVMFYAVLLASRVRRKVAESPS